MCSVATEDVFRRVWIRRRRREDGWTRGLHLRVLQSLWFNMSEGFIFFFFLVFYFVPLLLFGRKIHIASSLFRREVRLGADGYLRTTCWPSFGIPGASFSGWGPLRAPILLPGCWDKAAASHLLVPQDLVYPGLPAAASRKPHISVISVSRVPRGSSDPELLPATLLWF